MTDSALLLPIEFVRNCRLLPDRTDVLRYLPKDIVFVEIGVALGDFTTHVLETCVIRHFLAIDIFTMHEYPDSWGGRAGRELGGLDHRSFYERRFADAIGAGRMTLLEGDSQVKLEELADRSVDVFYVDADHSYESVKRDLAIIQRKLLPGGIVILNDYTMFDQLRMIPYGVVRAAHEFMIEERWEMIFLALHPQMFCDIAIREMYPRPAVPAVPHDRPALPPQPEPVTAAAVPAELEATSISPAPAEPDEPTPIDHPHQWFGGRTYAQHGDDLLILNIFKRIGIERPSYLDVGAHHPFDISNTALLYQRGSRGINVEANPNLIEAFRRHRPEDINLNVGVGPQRGNMRFYCVDPRSGRNSFVRNALDDIGISSEMEIPVVTILDIIETHAGGRFPDLLSLDVEGLDLAILETIRYEHSSPKVICVELMVGNSDASTGVKSLLASKGYFPYCWAGSNMMFVGNRYHARLY